MGEHFSHLWVRDLTQGKGSCCAKPGTVFVASKKTALRRQYIGQEINAVSVCNLSNGPATSDLQFLSFCGDQYGMEPPDRFPRLGLSQASDRSSSNIDLAIPGKIHEQFHHLLVVQTFGKLKSGSTYLRVLVTQGINKFVF